MASIHKKAILFKNISFYVFLATVGLLPVFFIPALSIEAAKSYLFVFGLSLSFIFLLISFLVQGAITIPKSRIVYAGGIVALAGLISAFFSQSSAVSFAGQAFSLGTSVSLLMLAVGLFLASVHFSDIAKVSYFYGALFAGFTLISLFQIAFLVFGPETLSLGVLFERTASVVGRWNDMAIFYGLVAMLTLFTLELFTLRSLYRNILYVALAVSVFFLALANFILVWVVLGGLSLILFIYTLSSATLKEGAVQERRFPMAAFIVVIIALFYVLANNFAGGLLSSYLKTSATDIRPSVQATFTVAQKVYQSNPVFGIGPNRFGAAWLMHRPAEVTMTAFADTSFPMGFGFIPTLMITMGAVGALALLWFLGSVVYAGVTRAFSFDGDKLSNYLIMSSFVAGLYLWVFTVAYTPGLVVTSLAFVFTGIFVGMLVKNKSVPQLTFNFLRDPRHSFFSIFALVVVLIGFVAGTYVVIEKFVALSLYQRATVYTRSADTLTKAEDHLLTVTSFDHSDLYYRALADVYLAKLQVLLSSSNLSVDNIKSEFQNIFGSAENAAQSAIRADTTNPDNWIELAEVYRSVVPLGITGAYDHAKSAYAEAQKRMPMSPVANLMLARLELDNKNTAEAKKYIAVSLGLKPNYTDAIFLLSQIEAGEGNLQGAIGRVEQISLLDPNNPGVFFQLGLLRYNNKDYSGAASALERAVILQSDHVNARYFLALSYEKLGENAAEIEQLTYLTQLLPNDPTVMTMLENAKAGKPALADTSAPEKDADSSKEPPLKEKEDR